MESHNDASFNNIENIQLLNISSKHDIDKAIAAIASLKSIAKISLKINIETNNLSVKNYTDSIELVNDLCDLLANTIGGDEAVSLVNEKARRFMQ